MKTLPSQGRHTHDQKEKNMGTKAYALQIHEIKMEMLNHGNGKHTQADLWHKSIEFTNRYTMDLCLHI